MRARAQRESREEEGGGFLFMIDFPKITLKYKKTCLSLYFIHLFVDCSLLRGKMMATAMTTILHQCCPFSRSLMRPKSDTGSSSRGASKVLAIFNSCTKIFLFYILF